MKQLRSTSIVACLTLAVCALAARTTRAERIRIDTLREAWVGEIEVGPVRAVMQFRIVQTDSGGTTAFFDSVTEGRTGFDAAWSIVGSELKFDVSAVQATYRGRLNAAQDEAVGHFAQGGRTLALTLRRQPTEYDDVNIWEKRPQRPKGPFPYDSEEVAFENEQDGLTLAGTLTIPRGAGKHPAVILISGSGPQDRDETLLNHKPFLVLADDLGRRGIAVLRYDDRGTASSTGAFENATTEDFARDASAALDFLEQHERIDAGRIGLLGHSEGGLIAPMVAAKHEDVAFIVLLAAPGVLGETISYSQSAAMTRAGGGDDGAVQVSRAVLDAVISVVKSPEAGADVRARIELAVADAVARLPEAQRERAAERRELFRALLPTYASPWFRGFLLYDPRPTLQQVKCPVLALNGGKDIQVLPELNLPEIEKALAAGKNRDFEVVELAGLNHLFQKCETGAMREYISIPETINPAALEKIGAWITSRTRSERK